MPSRVRMMLVNMDIRVRSFLGFLQDERPLILQGRVYPAFA